MRYSGLYKHEKGHYQLKTVHLEYATHARMESSWNIQRNISGGLFRQYHWFLNTFGTNPNREDPAEQTGIFSVSSVR